MTKFFALAILGMAFTVNVFANDGYTVPPIADVENFCAGFPCTTEQLKIWDKFAIAEPASAVTREAGVYSGVCFHKGPQYDGTRAHHAVFFISEVGGATHMSGKFSFFAPQNPYASWTVEQAAAEFQRHGEDSRIATVYGKSLVSDFSSKEELVRYWSRAKADGTGLVLVGGWGRVHRLFCELNRN